MYYKDTIISAIAADACEKVSGKVVRSLRQMTKGMQSGDDSPLKNIWDEICVQVQTQESEMWEAYLDTVSRVIQSELKPLKVEILQAIWLQTDAASDWESEIEDKIEYGEIKEAETKAPCDRDEIAEYILHEFVLNKAADWTNRRIRKFHDGDYEL